MMKVLILLCPIGLDPAACDVHSAITRLQAPDAMPEACAMSGETLLAARPHPIFGKQYAKVVCERMTASR